MISWCCLSAALLEYVYIRRAERAVYLAAEIGSKK